MKPKPKTIPAIRPSAAIEAKYRRRLQREIAAMQSDVVMAIKACWRDNPPVAMDASSAADLRSAMSRLGSVWRKRFNTLAQEMASYFAKSTAQRVDATLKASLKKAGFAVELKLTAAQQEAISATTAANVALIKSIPAQHLTDVEGAVMRSIQTGRDLATLSTELRQTYGVTQRRAKFIALDQSNKATATIVQSRQNELGLKAKWLHSAGGKTPRPSHVRQSGKEYDPKTGWYDPDEKVWCWPGTLINCRCVSISVVPGFD